MFSTLKLDDAVNATYFISLIGIIIIVIILIDTIRKFRKGIKDTAQKAKKRVIVALGVITALSLISMVVLNASYAIAVKHGAYTRDMTIATMYDGISHSPVEDTLPTELTPGTIIIYYRFDCPDCRAIYDDLMAASANVDNIYFISSRSPQGQALLEQYPVSEVPSGIYLRAYTYNGALEYTKKVLYYQDLNGNIVFNQSDFNRLVELQSELK